MSGKKSKRYFQHGFTAIDNRIFYLQEILTPNAFSLMIRLYRMTEGYDGKPKALANAYFQKTCNMSKNTVTRALSELEEKGLIYTKKRPRACTLYLINLEKMDDIFQEIRAEMISEFDDESQNLGNIENHESQNMTQCFPKYDLHVSQNMGTNKENNKHNIIKENTLSECDVKNDVISFDDFWNLYNKKVGRAYCEKKWLKLKDSEKELILQRLPAYIASTQDIQYRKNPLTYLNGRHWEDEIVSSNSNSSQTSAPANAPVVDISKRLAHLKKG